MGFRVFFGVFMLLAISVQPPRLLLRLAYRTRIRWPPLTIVTFTWTNPNGANPDIVESHRWCLMQRWESSVSPADPTLDANYIPLGTGGLLTFTDNSATDADRVVGAYSVTGLSNKEGTGATFSVQVTAGGVTNIDLVARGKGYNATDTIQLLDVDMGGGGAADITVTVSTVA